MGSSAAQVLQVLRVCSHHAGRCALIVWFLVACPASLQTGFVPSQVWKPADRGKAPSRTEDRKCENAKHLKLN